MNSAITLWFSFTFFLFSSFQVEPGTPDGGRLIRKEWAGFGHARGWNTDLETGPHLRRLWKQEVGQGYAQIVGNSKTIFIASGNMKKKPGAPGIIETEITARSFEDGTLHWSYRHQADQLAKQESFGGSPGIPQATPLLLGKRLFGITFTGELLCLDTNSGRLIWSKNLVEEFESQAVQFGFSSSPVACPNDPGHFVVFAAGESGGLIKLSVDGKVSWVNSVKTFSYATPTYAVIQGEPQWIVVSRNATSGVSDAGGKTLWRHQLNQVGLTNVPTPLVAGDSTILISGQGVKGSECLEISKQAEQWSVKQRWLNRSLEFFYTNWLMMDDKTTLACGGKYMVAFECQTGKALGRWRGFSEGNIVTTRNGWLVLSGRGKLCVLSPTDSGPGFVMTKKYSVETGRFWTAPSVINHRILIRVGKQLHCLAFSDTASADDLENLIEGNPQSLEFTSKNQNTATSSKAKLANVAREK